MHKSKTNLIMDNVAMVFHKWCLIFCLLHYIYSSYKHYIITKNLKVANHTSHNWILIFKIFKLKQEMSIIYKINWRLWMKFLTWNSTLKNLSSFYACLQLLFVLNRFPPWLSTIIVFVFRSLPFFLFSFSSYTTYWHIIYENELMNFKWKKQWTTTKFWNPTICLSMFNNIMLIK